MIKRAITRDVELKDYQEVDAAFTEDTFCNLIAKIEIILQLPVAAVDLVLLETMKEGKTEAY